MKKEFCFFVRGNTRSVGAGRFRFDQRHRQRSSGGAIPSVSIAVQNEATGIELKLTTNDSGYYSAPALKPGSYSVTVTHEGFAPAKRQKIELRVQDRLEVNFDLAMSTLSTEVTITEEAPRLESQSSSLGNVVGQRTIEHLPLNGSNFTQLALLGAGVLPAKKSAERIVRRERR